MMLIVENIIFSLLLSAKNSSTQPTNKKKTALDILQGLGDDKEPDASKSDTELEEF